MRKSRRCPRLRTLLVAIATASLTVGCGTSQTPTQPSATPSGPADLVATTYVDARTVDLTIDSPALRTRTTVRVLLPTDFAVATNRQWPVLYLLHGCCDSYLSWTRSTDIEALSAGSEVLIVMPDAGKAGFYSNWIDGPAWETFHLTELPSLLARTFRAGPGRAIAGNSMGGFGALSYTARHRGMFLAAASFSGIVHTRLSPAQSQRYLGLVESQGQEPLSLWGDPTSDSQRWAAHNPYDLASRLRDVPLFVSVGNGDGGPLDAAGQPVDDLEASLYAENIALRHRLQELGANATFDFYGPGHHDWPYWQRELHKAWPMLMTALGSPS